MATDTDTIQPFPLLFLAAPEKFTQKGLGGGKKKKAAPTAAAPLPVAPPAPAAPAAPSPPPHHNGSLAHGTTMNASASHNTSLGNTTISQSPPTDDPRPPPHPQNRIGNPIHVPYTPDLRARPTGELGTQPHNSHPMVLQDYHLLAEACQRGGKARMEGHAYYKIGEVMAQNPNTLNQSIRYFKKYLNICRRLNDLQGEAKALNCIGIAYQELGEAKNLYPALEYHSQHAEISDAAGIFIANTNMGLIYGHLEDYPKAIEHHKQALQYAVRAGDRQAEALALSNLGYMARSQRDLNTAKICMERHLELSTTLKDEHSAAQAYEELGMLCVERAEPDDAVKLFGQALDIAQRFGDQPGSNRLKCQIGVVNGNLKVDEHMRNIARNMGAKAERKVASS